MNPYPTDREIINDTMDTYYQKGRADLAKEFKDELRRIVRHNFTPDLEWNYGFFNGLTAAVNLIDYLTGEEDK